MIRSTIAAGVVLTVLGGSAALAQPPGIGPGNSPPISRPAVSPYLNLLRSGNSPGFNYYGLVRPELEFRQSIRNLQQQSINTQSELSGLIDTTFPATGHRTTFLNTGGYFLSGSGASRPGVNSNFNFQGNYQPPALQMQRQTFQRPSPRLPPASR
jgi:hypothetical protein